MGKEFHVRRGGGRRRVGVVAWPGERGVVVFDVREKQIGRLPRTTRAGLELRRQAQKVERQLEAVVLDPGRVREAALMPGGVEKFLEGAKVASVVVKERDRELARVRAERLE